MRECCDNSFNLYFVGPRTPGCVNWRQRERRSRRVTSVLEAVVEHEMPYQAGEAVRGLIQGLQRDLRIRLHRRTALPMMLLLTRRIEVSR